MIYRYNSIKLRYSFMRIIGYNSIICTILFAFIIPLKLNSQSVISKIDSFRINKDIKITIDQPVDIKHSIETIITFYALPNGNTTEQTMGKKMSKDDDWHFDIQHIRAQTDFIRNQLKNKNFVVIYLENDYKSWPSWKQKHSDYKERIPHLIDSLAGIMNGKHKSIYLNGHSGGGSFIFGYLSGVSAIPSSIKRISFLDSDYGYDNSYYSKIYKWLKSSKKVSLNVFAYNDSIALYNGKPFVSATGGTWYRSHLFLDHLMKDFSFTRSTTDSLIIFKSDNSNIQFYFKENLDRGIYHTQQVERNGFIHSVLAGTKWDSKKYSYYGERAYEELIK